MGAEPGQGAVPVNGVSGGAGPLGRSEQVGWRRRTGSVFAILAGGATCFGILVLVGLIGYLVAIGLGGLDADFITRFASRVPELAGVRAPLVGSVVVVSAATVLAFPIAVGAAIYLEEYAPETVWTRLVRANIATLAGVPSIVYGLLGLAIFVRLMGLGRSVASGAATLALLMLPILVIAAQEAIRAVPRSVREAAYGLGATRWQVVRFQVLPLALPGILTGAILAIGRAVGETAPLILVGAAGYLAFTPAGPRDEFTVLPLQIFSWLQRPEEGFREIAAAAILVLLLLLLTLNAVAIVLRHRAETRH